jgi:transposase
MIEALIDGERRGMVLAELARGVLRSMIPDLSMALAGRFNDHHALMCRLHLRHIDELTELIDTVEKQIEVMLLPFAPSATC